MWLVVCAGIAVVIVAFLGFAATRPDRFRVERSVTIDAPLAQVVTFIDDLHRWPAWSADEKDDPTMTRTYDGPARGTGAVCEWDSRRAGKARMEIVDASPQRVRVKVDWRRPFVASNVNEFTLAPRDESTLVRWTLDGENVYVLKVMTIFVRADRLMGQHLEKGLAALKRVSEKEPRSSAPVT
jgi:carbon monoxide dehydrogenase subunit G